MSPQVIFKRTTSSCHTRTIYTVVVWAVIVLCVFPFFFNREATKHEQLPGQVDIRGSPGRFEAIARKHSPVTDKVAYHNYGRAYNALLSQFLTLGRKVKMLEIGLGCGMPYGEGASQPVWLEYFAGVGIELHYFEFVEDCARRWQKKNPHVKVFVGDQANPRDLAQLYDQNYDIIVDDGGHTMIMQQTSFKHLFPNALSHGGVYFIEDLVTSYPDAPDVGGKTMGETFGSYEGNTTIEYIQSLIHDLEPSQSPSSTHHREAKDLYALMCWEGICAFHKD